jgi:hypothetical protein
VRCSSRKSFLRIRFRSIRSQALDALGPSRALEGAIYWNPNGYALTGIFEV